MCSAAPVSGAPKAIINKMRVLFVHTATLPPLGADTWVHAQIIRDLDRSTHDVYAACVMGTRDAPTPTFQVLSQISDLELRPVDFGPELFGRTRSGRVIAVFETLRAVPSLAGLAAFVRRYQVRIVHTSDRPRDAFACVVLARLTGAKCIIHAHVGYGEWMSPLLKWSLRRADALIAVSEFVGRTLVASGHSAVKIHVVPNAIDPMAWDPGAGREAARREFGVPQDAPVVVTVCRLFPAKGPGELIQVLPALRKEYPDLRLLIVGQEVIAGFQTELEQLSHELGVADNVIFTGRRTDVSRLMAAADIFAMPSFGEPFGLVFLEAMAMKLPVVALDSGGAPEVVQHGTTGLLSQPGDTDALAEHLLALLRDPGCRRRMGVIGRLRVETAFTTARMARDTALVYQQVASPRAMESSIGRMGMRALSEADQDEVQRNLDDRGYFVIRDVVSKDRLGEFNSKLVDAYQQMAKFEGGGSISGHLNCFPGERARFIYDEIEERGIADAIRALRPGMSNDVRPTLNFNLPGSKPQHYHMDGVYVEEYVICNIAVVDTDLVNGAIDLLPTTNQDFYPFWQYAVKRKFRLTTRIPMGQGDVLVRKSTLWHRGMPNMSDKPRPMMSLTFGEKSAPTGDPFQANDGKVIFYPNWYSTSRVGVLRERIEVAAPITRSSFRFVRSLVGRRGYSSY